MNYSEALSIILLNNSPSIDFCDCINFEATNSCDNCFIKNECHSIDLGSDTRQQVIDKLLPLARKEKLEKLLEK